MGMAKGYCRWCKKDLGDPRAFSHADLHECLKVMTDEIERLRAKVAALAEVMFDAEGLLEEQGRPEGERIDKGIEHLIRERDEAREAARWFHRVHMEGTPTDLARVEKKWPWLEEK